jgi:DNA repair protein RecO (recombination protein O)
LVWLFTEKLGKISTIAKGAKKNKSKLLSLTLPFCFGDYVVFKGKSMFTINEGELASSFQTLLNDLDSLTYASYLCELIDIALVDEESHRELFKEFIKVFYLMENKAISYDLLCRSFEINLLKASGYLFQLDHCCICRKKINTSDYIDIEYLGGLCQECERATALKITRPAYNSLRYLIKFPVENLYKLSLTSEVKEELYKLLTHIITNSFGKRPNSLQAFDYIKGAD